MKVEIKVTATELTPEDRDIAKIFCAAFERPDRSIVHYVEHLTEIEDRLIEAICARIKHDRANLIKWFDDGDAVFAKIYIIPAIDYIPEQ